MTKMFDLFDDRLFYEMVEKGYVKAQMHPTAPYAIYNYTDACTWDQEWNEVTLQCRGLIINSETDEVVSRGMPKFFNSDQEQAPVLELDDAVIVSDKMDGSLGILYKMPDGSEAIATRGSFMSEQAIWATKWWNENRPPIENLKPDPLVEDGYFSMDGWSWVFEIIYPDNRIVVDYGGKEGLVLLGVVRNVDGVFLPTTIPGVDSAPRFGYETWADVLAAPDRNNSEGFVVQRVSDSALVKVKYEDYKRLHKYMTRVTERHVWECLMEERDLEAEFAGAPDEFHVWIREVASRLWAEFDKRHTQLIVDYRKIMFGPLEKTFTYPHVEEREAKKNFALAVKNEKDKAYFFLMYQERSIISLIWKELKPQARTFKVVSSDSD